MAKYDIIFTNPAPSLHKDFIKRAYSRHSMKLLRPVFEKTGWIINGSVAYGVIKMTDPLGKEFYAVYFARKAHKRNGKESIVPLLNLNKLFFDKKKLNDYIKKQKEA